MKFHKLIKLKLLIKYNYGHVQNEDSKLQMKSLFLILNSTCVLCPLHLLKFNYLIE